MGKASTHWLRFLLVLIIFTPLFGLFSYNSGYGYDALEYFVIGRSLNEGYQLYDFIPSKSWLWYVFVQVGINLFGGDFNHVTITLLIVCLFVGCGVAVYATVRRITRDNHIALIAAILTMICSFFMEMNFLEPEAPIVILAVLSMPFFLNNSYKGWLIGGVFLGLAMLFKSIAMFYVVGAGAYLLYNWIILKSVDFIRFFSRGLLLLAGFAVPLILSLGYFYSTGKLEEHLYWSYVYPFGSYPPHTLFLVKLIIKTFWFILLTIISLGISLRKDGRAFWHQPLFILSFFFGLFSLVSLLKTQASHYLFAAAPFFSVLIALVLSTYTKNAFRRGLRPVLGVLCFGLLVAGVTAYTRPDAVKRFLRLDPYLGDQYVYNSINQHLSAGDKALLIDHGMYFYFHTHRYPNVPFINTEMQISDYVKRNPDVYEKSLQDTTLKLVLFGNRTSIIDDSTMANSPGNKIALDKLRKGLEAEFVQVHDSILDMKIWLRKTKY